MAAPGKSNAAMDAALAELDAAVGALQRHYELYFLGLERKEPSQDRDQLRRELMSLKRLTITNTGLKFKLNSLWNKYLSYERMWIRTVTEIEEGRYYRDVFKAKMRSKAREEAAQLQEAQQKGLQAAANLAEMSSGAKSAAAARGAQASRSGLTDDKLEKLYSAFVTAKKRCKEDTNGLTLEAMRKSLDKQIPAIKQKHNAKAVDFKVVIKGGKAILKAVPH